MGVLQFVFSIRVCQPSREFGERHPVCVSAVDRPTRLRPIPRTALADTAADRKQRPYIVALAAGRYWPGPKVAGELTFTSLQVHRVILNDIMMSLIPRAGAGQTGGT